MDNLFLLITAAAIIGGSMLAMFGLACIAIYITKGRDALKQFIKEEW
jgi:hypothetical protein